MDNSHTFDHSVRSAIVRETQVNTLPPERQILVIEDNPGDVRLLREALKDMEPPVTIQVANDCSVALSMLRGEHWHPAPPVPRLIFLDFNLPGSDPQEFLRQLKQDESLRLIPVAVLTGSDAEKDVRQAYGLYANCYLRKPDNLDEFFEAIQATAHFWLNIAYVPGEMRTGPKS